MKFHERLRFGSLFPGQAALSIAVASLLTLALMLAPAKAQSDAKDDDALAPFWWNDRVFYEIFLRSFQDSDSDGIGDLDGLIDRLDYLNDGDPETRDDLGVTGIWLMPPAEAHSYHGYDVTDYTALESDYGSADDMKRLIAAAHERGIAVIVDLVLNHTSSRHPWFLSSRAGDEYYADWYIWADEHPGYSGPWGAVAWHKAGNRYYYGVFWDGMPDLNLLNPAVTRELIAVAAFWLKDIGVDGFRLDAIKHLIEVGELQENTPESRAWLTAYETELEAIKPNSFTVGEVFNGPSFIVARYTNERAIDVGFDFKTSEEMISAAQSGNKRDIARAHRNAMRDYPFNQFATFLTNHDQDRLANQLLHDVGRNKVAAALLLTGPGVPFIYYGEEIGMAGTKPDERLRSPMHWENSASAGFTAGNTLWQPLQEAENLATANVADQLDDPDSLLSLYRDLIHLRNDNPALRRGDLTPVDSEGRGIYAFLRHDPQQTLLVLINLDDEANSDYSLTLDESELPFADAALIYGEGALALPEINNAGGFENHRPLPTLAPQTVYVIEYSQSE